ncbi:MAG TPA: N-6 DNA methylase [Methylocystis sp.]|nr:N-6 DNA methylase [Methylocystis sp.]
MSFQREAEKARGAFFTPPEVARFLVDWAVRSPSDRVLEPSCGDASFLVPAAARLRSLGATRNEIEEIVCGVEIHGPSALAAQARLSELGHAATIVNEDFFDRSSHPGFDVVVGNPPYVRYQNFSGAARAKSVRAALAQGVRLTLLASSWAAFTVHASQFLKDDGRLGLVLPAELLSVNYAAEVRRFLLSRFASVRLVLFEKLVFPGVLEEVVLLLAEGRGTASHFEVYQARDLKCLEGMETASWRNFKPSGDEKWTPSLIAGDALEVYRELTSGKGFAKLIEWGETYLGSVTGNNDWFTLTVPNAARLGIVSSELQKISPPGARHLRGLTFGANSWEQLASEGARCYLFAPGDNPSKAARAYIEAGERAGVHGAYKCRVRSPWWRVPLVAKPDLLFTYMNHERPRWIANEAGVRILNSLYGVELAPGKKRLGKKHLPTACLNTVTLLGSEIVGRAYGGGLLKHEPKEADLLPVPSPSLLEMADDELQAMTPQLGVAMRQQNMSKVVEIVDALLLEKFLKLDATQIAQLREAREWLFRRRAARGSKSNIAHRRPSRCGAEWTARQALG